MRFPSTALAALLAVAACSGGNTVSLTARVNGATAASAPTRGTSLNLGNGIVLSRIRMSVRKVKLKPADSKTDAGESESKDGGGDGDDREVAAGPFLIDLTGASLDSGAPQKVFDADVPAGTYRKIKFEIHKVEDAEAASPTFAGMAGKSVIIDGTVDSKAFSFSSSLDEEQEREGTITVGSKTNNLTLTLDPSGWFTSSGARLDPTDPNVDRSKIEQNIKASLDAFEDDDHDGKRD